MTFATENDPMWRDPPVGFSVVVGSLQQMRTLLLIRGTLPAEDRGWIHYHDGDEIIRVLRGEVTIVVGRGRKRCVPGDVAVVPPNTRHGFVVGREPALVEVISEQHMRSFISVKEQDGTTQMVELHRADVPFDRRPPPGRKHTTPQELTELVRKTSDPLEEI
jgi:quercetin dioxygenase-like cupin family protein